MNAHDDLDRRLAAALEDGPSRVPERSIDAAIAHAHAHPRRRDPLDDPQEGSHEHAVLPVRGCPSTALPRRHPGAGPSRPAFAVATAGGLFQDRSVVVPPVATPSPTPSPAPSGSAPASPSPSPSSPTVIKVDLIETVGADATIDIIDLSGALVGAVSGIPPDGSNDLTVTGLAADPRHDHPDLGRPAVRHDPFADHRTRWADDDPRAAGLPGRRVGHLPRPGADV